MLQFYTAAEELDDYIDSSDQNHKKYFENLTEVKKKYILKTRIGFKISYIKYKITLFFKRIRRYHSRYPPLVRFFLEKKGGGIWSKNFLLGISLLKNFPALRAGGK